MEAILLGTGTSQGIPVIGCDCRTCLSDDSRDKRLRCSMFIRDETHSVVIDVGPDFRTQMLRHGVRDLDAVILTHEHNDHVIGLDDLRPLIFRRKKPMKIYGEQRVLSEVIRRFDYAFAHNPYPGAPSFELIPIEPGMVIHVGKITLSSIRVYHGHLPVLAFRIGDLAYLTDVSRIPRESTPMLMDLRYLLLDCLRREKHYSHLNLEQAIQIAEEWKPQSTFLIHLSHLMGPTRSWEKELPPGVFPSFDGQRFKI